MSKTLTQKHTKPQDPVHDFRKSEFIIHLQSQGEYFGCSEIAWAEALWRLDKQYPEFAIAGP